MKKIMFYCQNLAGMGHLVRSTEIIHSLAKNFEVLFVCGGQTVLQVSLPPDVEVIHLPALWQDKSVLRPIDVTQTLEEVQTHRKQILITAFERFQPDCLITECFPFSKLKFKSELKPILERAKASEYPISVICSLRDLTMLQPMPPEAKERRAEKVCKLIDRYYDAIFFHADANLQTLEDSFPDVDNLKCDIIYTGYVAQSPPRQAISETEDIFALSSRVPTIVASVGGGRNGYQLISAIINASSQLGNILPHHIYAFAGPFMPADEYCSLQQAAADKNSVTLRRYTRWLIDYLRKADLSISFGGYNTTMNILRTRVKALVLPSLAKDQANEQRVRTEKLASLGLLQILSPEDLVPERLVAAISTCLSKEFNNYKFNLKGADNTSRQLQQILY